ncbi:MAG: hypothetical protein IPO78_05375 [Saprospiraceae bacterium]|nr:hypothetical protein [Saprospiraceae bacterium]MBK9721034.1 hypothetical protein [Saprospiraceae bacterium]
MMQLTRFSRILIVLAILAVLFIGYKKYAPDLMEKFGTPEANQAPPQTENTNPQNTNPSAQQTQTAQTSQSIAFAYKAPEPIDGKLKGVVELGASGFNSFIVRIDKQKNWKLEKSEFGSSLVHEHMATDDDVRNGLKNYIRGMLDFGVPGKDIHFVVSSGAKTEPSVVKISNGLKALGYYVNEVTAQQEGTYGLNCAMPPSLTNQSFMVDIGSGNTKISWMQNGTINALESHGSKYFQKSISDDQVYREVRQIISKVSSVNRQYCFIIGGIPFELAKQVRNGKERYTVLKFPNEYTATGEKQKAGINIYKAVADETACKTFVFDWDANFTIGFLLGLK